MIVGDKLLLKYCFSSGAAPTQRYIEFEVKCIICNTVKHKGVGKKSRIMEKPAAIEFVDAVHHSGDVCLQLRVGTTDWNTLIANDTYCHKTCRRTFISAYKAKLISCVACNIPMYPTPQAKLDSTQLSTLIDKLQDENQMSQVNRILQNINKDTNEILKPMWCHAACLIKDDHYEIFFKHIPQMIRDLLHHNCYMPLSDIRHKLENLYPGKHFRNQRVKEFLMSNYSDEINFCKPYQANESLIVYPSKIEKETIIAKIQHLNIMQTAGSIMRMTLLKDVNFNLEDSFCDHVDLVESWKKQISQKL